jgi:hypothetical protein
MNLTIPNRQRLLVIVTGVVVLLFVLDRIVFTPLTKMWQAHAAEIKDLRTKVATGRGTIARGPQTERVWADMQANALAKEPAQAEQDVISAFDRWGQSNRIELGSIRPQWKRGLSDRYSLLECRVDATGSLPMLTHFLYEMEQSPLALRVDSLEVTARDDGGQKLTLGLVVSGLRLSPLERKL